MNDKNPHERQNPRPYDQNPHQKPNPNRNSIIIAVCITVAACAVVGVSLFFLISALNKQNDAPKTTETTESTVQVTQASVNEVDTAVSTAAPPSTAVPTSTAKPTDPPTDPPTPEPTQDIAAELFQRLSGRELTHGFSHGSQDVTVYSDGAFSMLYHRLVFDNNNIRTMEYFSEAGSFSNVKKLNDFTYSMRIADTYTTTSDADAEKVGASYPTKAVEDSFGFYGGGEALVYMPEAPLSQIPESVLNKGGKMVITPNGDYLGYYCLVDAKGTNYYSKAY